MHFNLISSGNGYNSNSFGPLGPQGLGLGAQPNNFNYPLYGNQFNGIYNQPGFGMYLVITASYMTPFYCFFEFYDFKTLNLFQATQTITNQASTTTTFIQMVDFLQIMAMGSIIQADVSSHA